MLDTVRETRPPMSKELYTMGHLAKQAGITIHAMAVHCHTYRIDPDFRARTPVTSIALFTKSSMQRILRDRKARGLKCDALSGEPI